MIDTTTHGEFWRNCLTGEFLEPTRCPECGNATRGFPYRIQHEAGCWLTPEAYAEREREET